MKLRLFTPRGGRMKRDDPYWRSNQQMPDPLRGAWWLTAFFTVWFFFDRR